MDMATIGTRNVKRGVALALAGAAVVMGAAAIAAPKAPKAPKIEWRKGALARYNYPAILWNFDEAARRDPFKNPRTRPNGSGANGKASTAAVDGQFVDAETGKPIPEVEAIVAFGKTEPEVVLTDEKGRFSAESVPVGEYTVASHAPGYYDDKKSFYAEAGATTKVELRLRPRPASIAGKLADSAGKAAPKVRLVLKDEKGTAIQTLETLSDGSFGVFGLKPGKYTIHAEGGKSLGEVEIDPGDIKTLELMLK